VAEGSWRPESWPTRPGRGYLRSNPQSSKCCNSDYSNKMFEDSIVFWHDKLWK